MCLESADALAFGQIPHFHLRTEAHNDSNECVAQLVVRVTVARDGTSHGKIHARLHAYAHLPIAGAREQGGERLGVLGHAVDPVPVSIQRGHERLGEQPLELGGVQGPGVLSAHLKRMQGRVIVSGY